MRLSNKIRLNFGCQYYNYNEKLQSRQDWKKGGQTCLSPRRAGVESTGYSVGASGQTGLSPLLLRGVES